MRRPSPWNGIRYRVGWQLRILVSDLQVIGEDLLIWIREHCATPKISLPYFYGKPVHAGRGQRFDLRVSQCSPRRAARAYLRAVRKVCEWERNEAASEHHHEPRGFQS